MVLNLQLDKGGKGHFVFHLLSNPLRTTCTIFQGVAPTRNVHVHTIWRSPYSGKIWRA